MIKPGDLVQLSRDNMYWRNKYWRDKFEKHQDDFAILLPKEDGIHEYPVFWIKASEYDYQWLDDLELYDTKNRNTQGEIIEKD